VSPGKSKRQADFPLSPTCSFLLQRIFTESQAIKTLIDQGSTLLPLQPPEETWLSPTTPSPATPSFNASNPHTRLSVRLRLLLLSIMRYPFANPIIPVFFFQPSNLHLSSALLATHLSSALLSLRTKADRISLPTLVQKLNWRGDTRIIGLSGRAPIWDVKSTALGAAVVEGWDFSSAPPGARAKVSPRRVEERERRRVCLSQGCFKLTLSHGFYLSLSSFNLISQKYTPFFSHSVIRGVGESSLPALLASIEAESGGLKGHLLSRFVRSFFLPSERKPSLVLLLSHSKLDPTTKPEN